MKRILLSFIIAIALVVVSLIVYVLVVEPSIEDSTYQSVGEEVTSVKYQAQGLDSGKYIVFETHKVVDRGQDDWANDDTEVYTFWRYRIGDNNPEKIIDIISKPDDIGTPIAEKFSDESFAIWSERKIENINKQLVHLNGTVIGPAEDQFGIISPNRQWLVYQNSTGNAVLENIANSDQYVISDQTHEGYLRPVAWSNNSEELYLVVAVDAGYFVSGLFVYDIGSKTLAEITSVAELGLTQTQVYPDLKKAIGYNFSEYGSIDEGVKAPSSIQMIDLTDQTVSELLYNEDLVMINPKISPSGQYFSYSFTGDDPTIWIAQIQDPQQKNTNRVVSGMVLAWPMENNIIIDRDGKLQSYNWQTNDIITLASRQGHYQDDDYLAWSFINSFEIK